MWLVRSKFSTGIEYLVKKEPKTTKKKLANNRPPEAAAFVRNETFSADKNGEERRRGQLFTAVSVARLFILCVITGVERVP